jgi:hypothetical protein
LNLRDKNALISHHGSTYPRFYKFP